MSVVTLDILSTPAPVVRFRMELPAQPIRGGAVQIRVSVPQRSDRLPVILFSHGNGSSREGYGPLVDFWAAHRFAVIYVGEWTEPLASGACHRCCTSLPTCPQNA